MIEQFEIDELKPLFGDDFRLNDHMTIRQPEIGEIIEMGEREYSGLVQAFVATPSDRIAQLDKQGIDWNEITDFEMFGMVASSLPKQMTKILFGDFDFGGFEIIPFEEERRIVLRHKTLGFDFDELQYEAMVGYLRKVHSLKKNVRLAGNAATKQMMIEMAYEDLEREKKKPYKSHMKSLISALVNSPGFKYDLNQVRHMKFYAFMDSVVRTQIITSSTALMNGIYSGNIDTKKLDKNELNCMRDI